MKQIVQIEIIYVNRPWGGGGVSPYMHRNTFVSSRHELLTLSTAGVFYLVRDVAFTLGTPPVGALCESLMNLKEQERGP